MFKKLDLIPATTRDMGWDSSRERAGVSMYDEVVEEAGWRMDDNRVAQKVIECAYNWSVGK